MQSILFTNQLQLGYLEQIFYLFTRQLVHVVIHE